jgi:hypothetical protein
MRHEDFVNKRGTLFLLLFASNLGACRGWRERVVNVSTVQCYEFDNFRDARHLYFSTNPQTVVVKGRRNCEVFKIWLRASPMR